MNLEELITAIRTERKKATNNGGGLHAPPAPPPPQRGVNESLCHRTHGTDLATSNEPAKPNLRGPADRCCPGCQPDMTRLNCGLLGLTGDGTLAFLQYEVNTSSTLRTSHPTAHIAPLRDAIYVHRTHPCAVVL